MPAPTVPDAKSALLAALRARPGLQGVQVEWSHPGKGIRAETIYFGETVYGQRAARLGNRTRQEDYTLELVVTVEKAGDQAEACERRCWELLAEIEDELRSNADLDGLVDVAQYQASPVRNFVGASKRVSESVVSIGVESEL